MHFLDMSQGSLMPKINFLYKKTVICRADTDTHTDRQTDRHTDRDSENRRTYRMFFGHFFLDIFFDKRSKNRKKLIFKKKF